MNIKYHGFVRSIIGPVITLLFSSAISCPQSYEDKGTITEESASETDRSVISIWCDSQHVSSLVNMIGCQYVTTTVNTSEQLSYKLSKDLYKSDLIYIEGNKSNNPLRQLLVRPDLGITGKCISVINLVNCESDLNVTSEYELCHCTYMSDTYIIVLKSITEELSALDPQHKGFYYNNLSNLYTEYIEYTNDLTKRLKTLPSLAVANFTNYNNWLEDIDNINVIQVTATGESNHCSCSVHRHDEGSTMVKYLSVIDNTQPDFIVIEEVDVDMFEILLSKTKSKKPQIITVNGDFSSYNSNSSHLKSYFSVLEQLFDATR